MTYTAYRLVVQFADGTIRGFLASPIVAVSIEAALGDLKEAYGEDVRLVKDFAEETN